MDKSEIEQVREILEPKVEDNAESASEEAEEVDETTDEVEQQGSDESLDAAESEVVDESGDDEPDEALEIKDDEYYTPKQLSEAIGWEPEEIYNSVIIPMKDGEKVPLGELKNKYQDLSHEKAQLEQKLQEVETGQTQAAQGQQMSQEMIQLLANMDQINRVEQSTNWEELESLDPAEAVLKRDKIRTAREEVQRAIGEIQQKEQQAYQQFLQQQANKMVEYVPEWKDNSKRQEELGRIRNMLHEYEFTDQEIDSIIDARHMKLLADLARMKSRIESSEKAVKKVRKAPKVLSGKRSAPKADPKEKVKKLVEKARSTGRKEDELEAVRAILAGNG